VADEAAVNETYTFDLVIGGFSAAYFANHLFGTKGVENSNIEEAEEYLVYSEEKTREDEEAARHYPLGKKKVQILVLGGCKVQAESLQF